MDGGTEVRVSSDSESSSGSSSSGENTSVVGPIDEVEAAHQDQDLENIVCAEMQDQDRVPEDYNWVNEEIREMVSKIGPNSNLLDTLVWKMGHVHLESWIIRRVSAEERAYWLLPEKYAFYIYYETLARIHACPHYTLYEKHILNGLSLAQTQFHSNVWASLLAYQIIMDPLGRSLLDSWFFALFTFVRSRKNAWVSFWASEKSDFSLYLDSLKDFKDYFASIVARNLASKKKLSRTQHGVTVCSRFPLSWNEGHYSLHPSDFLVSPENLDADDQESLRMIEKMAPLGEKELIDTRSSVSVETSADLRRAWSMCPQLLLLYF